MIPKGNYVRMIQKEEKYSIKNGKMFSCFKCFNQLKLTNF